MTIPKHVAIIMDGNGRWGIKKKNSRNFGHKNGIKVVQEIINEALKKKIEYLTLYTFSTENWKRPKKEINFFFNLLENFLLNKISDLNKQNIKLKIIGKKNFSQKLNILLKYAEKKPFNNKTLQINLALNYGSKSELVNALARTKDSPFFGIIKRPSDPVGAKGVITDTALIKVTENSLNNYGALSLYKGVGRIPDDLNGMYEIMFSFWDAVREVFPEAWGLPSTESRLMHSAGIQAMGHLMDRIIPRIPRDKNLKTNINNSLLLIQESCAWTQGEWDGLGMAWNEIQSVPRHIRMLSEHLIQLDYTYNTL